MRKIILATIGATLLSVVCLPAWALNPNLPPSGNFDLSHWKLQLPINASGVLSGTTDATEIPIATLITGFTNAYFYTGADGAMVFWSPVTGATTSGTTYPRSELRELLNPNDTSVDWTGYGMHSLNIMDRVLQVPSTGKVIIGQIKEFTGNGFPLVKIEYENGNVLGIIKTNASNDGSDYTIVNVSVGLSNNIIYMAQMVNGLVTIAINGVTNSLDVFHTDPDWETNLLYFKAGDYCQDNTGTSNEGARVAIYSVGRSHAPSITNQPSSRIVPAGSTTNFNVTALGNGPLTYQWRLNTTNNLTGATNSSCTITNASAALAGNHTVIVTDSFGSVTSAVAALTIDIPPLFANARIAANRVSLALSGMGTANQPYVLLTATNLTPLVTWKPVITNNADSGGVLNFTDGPVANQSQRFYRISTP